MAFTNAVLSSMISSAQTCQLLENTAIAAGKYCPASSPATLSLHDVHHYRATCFHAENCEAYNYNTSDTLCARLTAPCPLAQSNPSMEFGVFIPRKTQSCFVWLAFARGDRLDEQMVITSGNPTRAVAQATNNDAHYFGFYHERQDGCFIATNAS